MHHLVADCLASAGPWVDVFSLEACLLEACLVRAFPFLLRADLPEVCLLQAFGWDSGRRRHLGQAEEGLVSC